MHAGKALVTQQGTEETVEGWATKMLTRFI
jgi:hypothetical protein